MANNIKVERVVSMKLKRNEQGFTIIEVVLVLAIAGLIFLMVFLALPALQRGQRDTQRRDDMSRFISQIQNFQANNAGDVPTAAEIPTFVSSYMTVDGDAWADPTTGSVYTSTTTDPDVGEFQYGISQTCDGENFSAVVGGARKVAVRTKLEGAGFACFNN